MVMILRISLPTSPSEAPHLPFSDEQRKHFEQDFTISMFVPARSLSRMRSDYWPEGERQIVLLGNLLGTGY